MGVGILGRRLNSLGKQDFGLWPLFRFHCSNTAARKSRPRATCSAACRRPNVRSPRTAVLGSKPRNRSSTSGASGDVRAIRQQAAALITR